MKKLCNASAIAAFLTAVCFTAVSCNKTPSESTLPVEKELGVSIELTSATETSVSVDITAEKDAEGYIYAIGEAGKLNEFQNGTMEGIQTQNDPTVKSASFDGLTKATDYTIYAQAFAGEEKGNVRQLVVTTEDEPDFDLTTTTTIDNITEDSFVIRVEFGADTRTRLRPSYFPFTEPSVEVDVSCFECHGKGCPLCKHTGWIEVLGGGVVNRKVLENCNIDPDEYSGFAFGIGIERIAMLKYGINNIGLMFENNLQFLKQFHE